MLPSVETITGCCSHLTGNLYPKYDPKYLTRPHFLQITHIYRETQFTMAEHVGQSIVQVFAEPSLLQTLQSLYSYQVFPLRVFLMLAPLLKHNSTPAIQCKMTKNCNTARQLYAPDKSKLPTNPYMHAFAIVAISYSFPILPKVVQCLQSVHDQWN
jgi:hypothetical protein